MWPTHTPLRTTWISRVRGEEEITTSLPPLIGSLTFRAASDSTAWRTEAAAVAVARLDASIGAVGERPRVWSEARASSRIESIHATAEEFARALAGHPASAAARRQLAAVEAHDLLTAAGDRGTVAIEDVLSAHRALLDGADEDAGQFREEQNWIGSMFSSPHTAIYVPPPPERVPELMEDLLRFVNRSDMPVIVQAALAHAQYESIHPFSDGNGRTGRALIAAIFKRRGLTQKSTVPLSVAIESRKREYYEILGRYRTGNADAVIRFFCTAIDEACGIADEWAADARRGTGEAVTAREGSSEEALLRALIDTPILDTATAGEITGASPWATSKALARLTERGVLESVGESPRKRVWISPGSRRMLAGIAERY